MVRSNDFRQGQLHGIYTFIDDYGSYNEQEEDWILDDRDNYASSFLDANEMSYMLSTKKAEIARAAIAKAEQELASAQAKLAQAREVLRSYEQ